MKNIKEVICIISVTLLHGLITSWKLGGMPHISFLYFDEVSVIAMVLWAAYGAVLFLVAQKWGTETDVTGTNWIKMLVFSACVPLLKGIIDLCVGKLTENVQTAMGIAVADGVVNLLFGAMLMYLVLCVAARKRLNCVFREAKLEMGLAIGILMLYVIIVGYFFWQNYQAIDYFGANVEQIQNLDYHFALKIVDGNVYCYVLFYVFFWSSLKRATQNSIKVE